MNYGLLISLSLLLRLGRGGGEVCEGALDDLRYWGSGGQVSALRLESVFVSSIRQLDVLSVLTGVLELALHLQSLNISDLLEIALLVRTNSVSSFKGVLI